MKRIVIACDGTWSRLDARHPDQRRQARPGGAAGGAGRGGAGRLPPRRGGERARHRAAGAGRRPGAGRGPRRGADGDDRGGLPLPRLRLCAGGRDLSLRLLARRLHRALARRADPQLRHPRAPPRRRHPGGAGALPGAVADDRAGRPGGAGVPGGACGARDDRAPARRRGGRRGGCRRACPSRSAISGSGTPWERWGCRGTWRWRGGSTAGSASTTPALSGLVGAARHAVAIDERRRTFPPTLWDNLDAMNGGEDGPLCPALVPGRPRLGRRRRGGQRALRRGAGLGRRGGGGARPGARPGGGGGVAGRLRLPRAARLAEAAAAPAAACSTAPTAPGRRGSANWPSAAVRRWRGDPGYRPRPLRRLAGLIQV